MSNKPDKSSFLRAESELVLDLARQEKEKKIADRGSPLKLKGQALDMVVRGDSLWVAENTGSVLVIDLNTNETVSTFKCHQAPVATFVFVDKVPGSGDGKIMITGSWDKIKIWDTEKKQLLSTTQAHSDFVKVLLVLSNCNLLVSASSDKVIRLWDLSTVMGTDPLVSVGSISAHTRPVETLGGDALSNDSAILYTADTMGVLKIWLLERDDPAQLADGLPPRWRTTLREDLTHHRTRINQLVLHNGYIWTDETVKIHPDSSKEQSNRDNRPIKPIQHPVGVKALLPLYVPSLDETYLFTASGDIIRSWDTSDLNDKIEQRNEMDGHWHDVTLLKAWFTSPDLYIMSASLDGTIRRWKVKDLLTPKQPGKMTNLGGGSAVLQRAPGELTEEEEREMDELLNDDD